MSYEHRLFNVYSSVLVWEANTATAPISYSPSLPMTAPYFRLPEVEVTPANHPHHQLVPARPHFLSRPMDRPCLITRLEW